MSDATKDDGGFAFPHPQYPASQGSGMTLRDWFAGQALAGMLSNGAKITVTDPALTQQRVLANAAYTLADAMLAAR